MKHSTNAHSGPKMPLGLRSSGSAAAIAAVSSLALVGAAMAGFSASAPVGTGAADSVVGVPLAVQAITVPTGAQVPVSAPQPVRMAREIGTVGGSRGSADQPPRPVPASPRADLHPGRPPHSGSRPAPSPAPSRAPSPDPVRTPVRVPGQPPRPRSVPPSGPTARPPTAPPPKGTDMPGHPTTGEPFSAGFSEEEVQLASDTVQEQVLASLLRVAGPDDRSRAAVRTVARSIDPSMDHAVRQALDTAAGTAHDHAAQLFDLPYCSTELIEHIASTSFRSALPGTLQRAVVPVLRRTIDQVEPDAARKSLLRSLAAGATSRASSVVALQSAPTVVEAVSEAAEDDPKFHSDDGLRHDVGGPVPVTTGSATDGPSGQVPDPASGSRW